MQTDRTILHVDMDAFFASVEQHDNPALKGKPVVVGAPGDKRGVIAAASYEARTFGIHSAMPSREAKRRCPHAVFVPVNGSRYREVSEQIFEIFKRFTPLVEPLSVDEAFLDVTGSRTLFGDGPSIAEQIRETIKDETGLTASVGVASNKFLAKLASDLDKPDGLVVVPRDPAEVRTFLAPLPVGRIWGVGKVTRTVLEGADIRTMGDIQERSEEDVAALLGKRGAGIIKVLAEGLDDRDVETDYEEQSVSREHTFDVDCEEKDELEKVLLDLVDDVGRRLRDTGKYVSVAHLKLRWKDFTTITRQRPFTRPSCDYSTFREMALRIFRDQELVGPVRLIGFGVTGLTSDPSVNVQLDLFDPGSEELHEKRVSLSDAIDSIREKFGKHSIRRMPRG